MKDANAIRFPNESEEYRKMRRELLHVEIEMRKQMEQTAALRRKLPLGGRLKEDYIFQEGSPDLSDEKPVKETRFSELFQPGKDTLVVYSFMFAPQAENPCPMCTSLLDGINGNVPHILDRVNFAVAAKAPLIRIRSWAKQRGWNHLRLLSSGNNSYNTDYFAEDEKGNQWPALNVFRRTREGIFHFYNTELLFAPREEGQDARHVDPIWPLWNVLDLTPEGRGENWYPKFSYS